VALSLALPASSWANISNTASVTFKDAANNSYSANSNTVSITTPPVITSSTTATGNVGVAFSYQITATNSPTGYGLGGTLPAGLSINNTTGVISGTPTTSGSTPVTVSATNAAGTGSATLTITILGPANVVLTKTSSAVTAQSGNTITFTIQYQNTGTGNASSVTITDVVPTGSTLVSGSITGGGTSSGSTITWSIGAVAAGGSGSVSFQVTVN
jgi:uncharacterized repeat protein (TIGR01451 family)